MTPYKVSLKLPAESRFHVFFSQTSVELIKKHLETQYTDDFTKFYSECTLLMHELFTNAINHSGSAAAEFEFTFADTFFSIDMITDGDGFIIKPVNPDSTPGKTKYNPPFSEFLGKSFTLHLDDDFEVVCDVVGEYELCFHNRERTAPITEDSYSVPEHFGLFIITKLGFDVTYKKRGDGKNFFSVKRKLPI